MGQTTGRPYGSIVSWVRRVADACWPGDRQQRSVFLRRGHAVLTVAWLVMVPVALMTGWIESLIFVSACSIYANAVGHFSAWQAGRAEESVERSGSD